jgi:hypothetical protein
MRWRLLAAIGLVASVIALSIVIAQDCTSEHCIDLPAVMNPGPTQVPTATRTPLPQSSDTALCLNRGPAPAEGAQVWMLAYNLAPGAKGLMCSRLTLNGAPVRSALVRIRIHYPDQDRVDSGLTRIDGIFALPITVAPVRPYQLIAIEAEIEWEGRLHGAMNQFLSQPVPTAIPTRTMIPTATSTETTLPTDTLTPTS